MRRDARVRGEVGWLAIEADVCGPHQGQLLTAEVWEEEWRTHSRTQHNSPHESPRLSDSARQTSPSTS